MRKFLLIFMFLIIISCSKIFAYYNAETSFIDFLVHTNQFRIRLDALGVNADITGSLKIAGGITSVQNFAGMIVNNTGMPGIHGQGLVKFIPAAILALGYKNDSFGIGAGLEFLWKTPDYQVYTPVLSFNALNDDLRLSVPVSVGIGNRFLKDSYVVSMAAEGRYYINKGPFYHLRFKFNYGYAYLPLLDQEVYKDQFFAQNSVGGELRLYFRIEAPNNVYIDPIIRAVYDHSLGTKFYLSSAIAGNGLPTTIADYYSITAKSLNLYDPGQTGGWGQISGGANTDPNVDKGLSGGYVADLPEGYYAKEPYRFAFAIPVGFSASSEFIDFYLEPAVSFTMIGAKEFMQLIDNKIQPSKRKAPFYTIGYVVYAEITLRAIKDLEWYTELQTGGASVAGNMADEKYKGNKLIFNASTGITWHF
ncbi:cell surface protein [Brachyspira sp.]|uniref:cell surface protein n=1 Tax=Brachyspira sp. TaxID=1977261 RepID=UPI00263922EA|nr:cell surface protein [Brachyspira sp.]